MTSRLSSSPLARIGCLWPVVGLAFGLTAAVALIGVGGFALRPRLATGAASPIVVRLPAPTGTPTASPTPAPAPTETPSTDRSEGTFRVGDLVEVFGTGGDGVRLRGNPSLEGTVNGLGQDGQVYQVIAGPSEGEGYTWWQIVWLDDPARQGWAVGTFLRLLD